MTEVDFPIAVSEEPMQAAQETEKSRACRNLYILVHPLFLVPNTSWMPDKHTFNVNRNDLYEKSLERFVPTNSDDVLLFMPHIEKTFSAWKGEIKLQRQGALINPATPSWIELFKKMRKLMRYPKNLIIAPDIVYENRGAREIIDSLNKAHRVISLETQIIIGGEWLNACVQTAVFKLLQLSEINHIKLDKKTVLTAAYALGTPKELDDQDKLYFVERFAKQQDLEVTEMEEYLVIERVQKK